jgi:hypothetical protein
MGPNEMKHLFWINAEGGPLVCSDAQLARNWKGAGNGGGDYERLCGMFAQDPQPQGVVFQISGQIAFGWEMGGAGTVDVFCDNADTIRIVRAWTDSEGDREAADEVMILARMDSKEKTALGTIEIPSGYLAIFWSVEPGVLIPEQIGSDVAKIKGTSIEASGYIMKAAKEKYICFHDEIETENSEARRLTLKAV